MTDETGDGAAMVTAGDIARLGAVGRAAVSNWRRRHEDFPRPVAGTTSSPLFALGDVERWLRRTGKAARVPTADRAWHVLRAAGDDQHLGERVATVATALHRGDRVPPELAALAADRGAVATVEFLCARYHETLGRRLAPTPVGSAELMARLVLDSDEADSDEAGCDEAGSDEASSDEAGRTVLDPACGTGTLLLAAAGAGAARVLGTDLEPAAAALAGVRLALRGTPALVWAADALRADPFDGERADAVLCDPPAHQRGWGHQDLVGDPRWEHGLPPRGEPELAWVQHCLARARPGGRVAVLLPAAVAARRPGRRIRSGLLRSGALRAVAALGEGSDLWLLRRPRRGERPPAQLLLLDAVADPRDVLAACRRHLAGDAPGHGTTVPVLDLLDDEVDLSPVRAGGAAGGDPGPRFVAARARPRRAAPPVPELAVVPDPGPWPVSTVGELVRAGVLTVRAAPAAPPGDIAVLTADDLAAGAGPSGRADPGEDAVHGEPGDVVAAPTGAVRVLAAPVVLGPHLVRYRTDPDRLDPWFLAGVLHTADHRGRPGSTRPGSSRFDQRRITVPAVPPAEQRALGAAVRDLLAARDAARAAAAEADELARLGLDGLVSGRLRPPR